MYLKYVFAPQHKTHACIITSTWPLINSQKYISEDIFSGDCSFYILVYVEMYKKHQRSWAYLKSYMEETCWDQPRVSELRQDCNGIFTRRRAHQRPGLVPRGLGWGKGLTWGQACKLNTGCQVFKRIVLCQSMCIQLTWNMLTIYDFISRNCSVYCTDIKYKVVDKYAGPCLGRADLEASAPTPTFWDSMTF